ncbi:MAG TPA: c-type cytochrome domain-containing protein, partial [Roseimicrobium sp.]|nr:c-type cytochrome domain-containing protein [Roseimicrobium sp.]
KPLLDANCTGCHGAEKAKGKYRLDAREAAIKGGSSGDPAIIPGKSESSPLVHYAAYLVPDMEMPPKDAKGARRLSDSEIALLRAWIDQGAKY